MIYRHSKIKVKAYHVDFVYYTDVISHIMTALTASLHAAGTFSFKQLLIQKHGFIPINVFIRPRPMDITSQSKTSAPAPPGTLISFINPLSVENHDFDGMEHGSYIVNWSMIKFIKYHDWRSTSLELESIHRFLPWNPATSKISWSFTDCLRLCFRMVHYGPAWFMFRRIHET